MKPHLVDLCEVYPNYAPDYSFALQKKPSNNDKNFLIMYLHVDNVYEVLHSWNFYF